MRKLTATICLTIAVLLESVGMSWSAPSVLDAWKGIEIIGCREKIDISPGFFSKKMKNDEGIKRILLSNKNRKTLIGRAITIDSDKHHLKQFQSFVSTLGSLRSVQGKVDKKLIDLLEQGLKDNWAYLNDKTVQDNYINKQISGLKKRDLPAYELGKINTKFYTRVGNTIILFQKIGEGRIENEKISGWKIVHLAKLKNCLVHIDTFLNDKFFNERDALRFFQNTNVSSTNNK